MIVCTGSQSETQRLVHKAQEVVNQNSERLWSGLQYLLSSAETVTEPYRQRLLATYYKHGHSYYQQYSKDANDHFEGLEPWQIALASALTMLFLVQLWRVQHKRWAPIRTVGRDVHLPFTCSWHVSCYILVSQPHLHGEGIIWRSVFSRN